MRELILIVPGLTGRREGADEPGDRRGERKASAFEGLDALARLLARADRMPVPPADFEALLMDRFGLGAGAGPMPPVAPLALLGETGERRAGVWLRADPVHLQAGMDKAVMLGSAVLRLDAAEAAALAGGINREMEADGLLVEPLAPERWYAACPPIPLVELSPLPETLGADVYHHMPPGKAGRAWRRLMNHTQMVLHASPVNAGRRGGKRPEVSGLWFWGAGTLPETRPCGFATVWGDDPLVRGLALNGGVSAAALPADGNAWLDDASSGTHLVAIDRLRAPLRLRDVEVFEAELTALHDAWLQPLARALSDGRLDRLRICPGEGAEYDINRRAMRWRWWRRPGALGDG